VPADAGVDDRGAGRLDGLGELHDFVPGAAVLDQVEHRQAEDDDEVGADLLARAAHDLDGEADAVLEGRPIRRAVVGLRRDELVDQVALGAHDLDAVVAGLLREARAAGVVGDGLLRTPQPVSARGAKG
jgi:hypothetical protein